MNNRWCYIITNSEQKSSMSWPSLNCFFTGLQQGISAALLQYFRGSSSPVKRLPPFSMGPDGWNYGTWWGPPSASSKAIVRSSVSCGIGVPVFHNFSPVTSWSEGIAISTSITGSHKSTKSPESVYTSLLNFSVFFFLKLHCPVPCPGVPHDRQPENNIFEEGSFKWRDSAFENEVSLDIFYFKVFFLVVQKLLASINS